MSSTSSSKKAPRKKSTDSSDERRKRERRENNAALTIQRNWKKHRAGEVNQENVQRILLSNFRISNRLL